MNNAIPVRLMNSAAPINSPSIDQVIDALQMRVKWTLFRSALKTAKFSPGNGWKELAANAVEKTDSGLKLEKFIREYFQESIIVNDRYVQLFDLTEDLLSEIESVLVNFLIPQSEFKSAYPAPLQKSELICSTEKPALCEIRVLPSGDVSFVFCAVRSFDDKNSYSFEQLPNQVKDTYKTIDKLVTYSKVFYQAYDVITIRKKLKRIEVSIDQPEKCSKMDLYLLPLNVLTAISLHITGFSGIGAKVPLNLFPAIAEMYAAKSEGVVKNLAFRTMTGSEKKERMTASCDLRAETFHFAGMNALGQKIKPYELTLEYEFRLPPGNASVRLAAQISELNSATPTLNGCYVVSSTIQAFEQALNRVVTFI